MIHHQQQESLLQVNYYSNDDDEKTSKSPLIHHNSPSRRRQMSQHKSTRHSHNCHLNHYNHPHSYYNIQQLDHDHKHAQSLLTQSSHSCSTQNKAPIMNSTSTNHQIKRIPTSATTITNARSEISTTTSTIKRNKKRQSSSNILRNVFKIILFNFIFNHLKNCIYNAPPTTTTSRFITATKPHLNIFETLPRIVQVAALVEPPTTVAECSSNDDCGDNNKICLDNKCTCRRELPVEDKDQSKCLNLAIIGESCHLDEQCLGNSKCLAGLCSCPSGSVEIFNPSTKINYCHPKRQLNEECSHDTQCPENGFCANKRGCLCQNGYGPQLVGENGSEGLRCLPKTCSSDSDCESEHHRCEENRCKCLATHFDPHTAGCYIFGSTGGKPVGDDGDTKGNLTNGLTTGTTAPTDNNDNSFTSILNDLTSNGDRMWLVILILILLTILLALLVFLLLRRHYRGYCWTKHKIGYEPNSANKNNPTRRLDEVGDGGEGGGLFNKNSITNKSFRRMKDEETDDYKEDDTLTSAGEPRDTTAKSNLVTSSNNTRNKHKTNNNKDSALLINQNVFVCPANGISSNNNNNMTNKNNNKNSHNNNNHDHGGHVKVDMNHGSKKDVDADQEDVHGNNHKRQTRTRDQITNGYYNQAPFHPLASSTSTPV